MDKIEEYIGLESFNSLESWNIKVIFGAQRTYNSLYGGFRSKVKPYVVKVKKEKVLRNVFPKDIKSKKEFRKCTICSEDFEVKFERVKGSKKGYLIGDGVYFDRKWFCRTCWDGMLDDQLMERLSKIGVSM